jgi:hypothetical protein
MIEKNSKYLQENTQVRMPRGAFPQGWDPPARRCKSWGCEARVLLLGAGSRVCPSPGVFSAGIPSQ